MPVEYPTDPKVHVAACEELNKSFELPLPVLVSIAVVVALALSLGAAL